MVFMLLLYSQVKLYRTPFWVAFPLPLTLVLVWAWLVVLILLGLPHSYVGFYGSPSYSPLWIEDAWWATDVPSRLLAVQILLCIWLWIRYRFLRHLRLRRWAVVTATVGLLAGAVLLAILSRGVLASLGSSPLEGFSITRIHP